MSFLLFCISFFVSKTASAQAKLQAKLPCVIATSIIKTKPSRAAEQSSSRSPLAALDGLTVGPAIDIFISLSIAIQREQ